MRMIDADVLKAEFDEIANNSAIGEWTTIPIKHIKQIIDNAPTVEPICPYLSDNEVKQPCIKAPCERPQGEWKTNYTSQFFNPGRSCSLCGKIVEFSENYCPNCGAHMKSPIAQ